MRDLGLVGDRIQEKENVTAAMTKRFPVIALWRSLVISATRPMTLLWIIMNGTFLILLHRLAIVDGVDWGVIDDDILLGSTVQ